MIFMMLSFPMIQSSPYAIPLKSQRLWTRFEGIMFVPRGPLTAEALNHMSSLAQAYQASKAILPQRSEISSGLS